ncbi:YadA-like family protein [Paraburkholderia sp. 22B1P]|uniref:YadA family autotransporter adhesin n=1 Tax=Paraburkholderia sp. 22B1P TaxID=3080498 RepID=UPI003087FFA4|nr:YadA-like family protein [Paraburkholderia sp. 22B1P]
MTAMPAWAGSIANNYCSPDGPGSGTWSNVAGCYTNAGAQGSLHNLGETVIGSYGYVPTNISFGTIFGFAGQANATYGTALGANGVVSSGAQNSVALGSGSVATDPNTVSVGRVGNNPLYNVHTDNGDGTAVDATPMNQSLLGTLTRRITNMSAGINDNDAVNVSQVKGVTKALGGGAGVNSDGSIAAPKYAVQGANFSDVGSALSKLDSATTANSTSITNIQNTVNNISNGNGFKYVHVNSSGADSVASGSNAVAVGMSATGAGQSGVALGSSSLAKGDWSEAIGNSAQANALGDIALGASSTATGGGNYLFATALGTNATAAGSQTTAVGGWSQATAAYATAEGYNSQATGSNGTAVGVNSKASQTGATALGSAAIGSGQNALAAGTGATASAYGDVAVGYWTHTAGTTNITNTVTNIVNGGGVKYFHANSGQADAVASGSNSVAVGDRANSMGGSSVAVGDGATAVGAASVAIGNNAKNAAAANNSVAIGGDSASGDKSVTIGNGANSTNSSWAVAVGTNANVSGALGVAIGGGSVASGANGVSIGPNAIASGANTVALGSGANASAGNSVALGQGSTTTANLSAAGWNPGSGTLSGIASAANGEVSVGKAGAERRVTNVAAGSASTDAVNVSQLQSEDAKVNGISSNVSNLSNTVNNINTATVNISNLTNTVNNIVNGGGIKYFHSNSTLADSVAAGVDSVAIGGAASASAVNSVALGAGSTTTANLSAAGWNPGTGTLSGIASAANGEVSVGASGKERRITNVAAGYAATDAVNVSQLQSEDAKVNAAGSSIANVLGGGSTYDASTGTITGPTFTLGGKTVTSIAGAITNLDDRVTQNSTSISNIMNQIDNGQFGSLVQQVSPTGAVTVAASTGGTLVNFAGTAGARVLTGVANGSVNASSKDAVNGSQLYATNQNLANLTNVVNNISTTGSGTGAQSKYFHANSTLADSSAMGTNATAIGGAASASGANSVALGSGSVADSDNTVSVGSAGNERRITNVADAVAGTDAVNYAQMNAALAKVQNAPAGSDAMVAVDGDRVTEAASVNGTHAMAMGPSASATASQAIASGYNAQASGDSSIAMGANSKATAERAVALGDGSIADRANTVSVGSADNQRQITNVAAGTQTTDAVNVGQLNSSIAAAIGDMPAGMSAKDYTDQQIQQVQAGVNDVARNAYSGIAAATALTMIPDVDQGKTIAVGIGGASYKGYAASALGISARITQNIKVKAGAGISAQGTTFGVGGSYQW